MQLFQTQILDTSSSFQNFLFCIRNNCISKLTGFKLCRQSLKVYPALLKSCYSNLEIGTRNFVNRWWFFWSLHFGILDFDDYPVKSGEKANKTVLFPSVFKDGKTVKTPNKVYWLFRPTVDNDCKCFRQRFRYIFFDFFRDLFHVFLQSIFTNWCQIFELSRQWFRYKRMVSIPYTPISTKNEYWTHFSW